MLYNLSPPQIESIDSDIQPLTSPILSIHPNKIEHEPERERKKIESEGTGPFDSKCPPCRISPGLALDLGISRNGMGSHGRPDQIRSDPSKHSGSMGSGLIDRNISVIADAVRSR
jgi:hypothetical protein